MSKIYIFQYFNTNNTAQNGRGNFKNRKFIGEISCYKSGMAK